MKEWSGKYNSFNSDKGLTYVRWYEKIAAWEKDRGLKILPPIEASIDPILACNLKCDHCNAHKYLEENKHIHRFGNDELLSLVDFLGYWGVKAVCFGGGGEPTMHSNLESAILRATDVGMQSSVATNGILLKDTLARMVAKNCRWVGVSVDAATRDTYKIGRKADYFDTVIKNIDKIASIGGECDVCFKFLIFDYNQHEIFEACKLAKNLGVKDFHARPADLSHQGMGEFRDKATPLDVDRVIEQFDKCRELEDDDFRVFTVVHKFNKDFTPNKKFSQCYAAPCCIQICPDKSIYFCPDQRYQDMYKLGSFDMPEDILKIWGKGRHWELTFKTGKKNCSTRCTWSPYCEQCERLFIKQDDPMCRYFI
jgi:MoaA/NifB/PqqE/SkfB family radical SAM enzyme